MHDFSHWFTGFPPLVAVALLAIMPVAELRGSIPYGIVIGHLPVGEVVLVSILFTWIGGPLAYGALHYLLALLERNAGFARWWERRRGHVKLKYERSWQRWGAGAILFLIALPIPVLGGVYTGTLAAYLLGMRFRQYLWVSFIGVCIAGALVTAAVLTGSSAMRWMLKQ